MTGSARRFFHLRTVASNAKLLVFLAEKPVQEQGSNLGLKDSIKGPCKLAFDFRGIALELRRCQSPRDFHKGKCIHEYIAKNGFLGDLFLGNLLIQMYGKCGSVQDARNIFDNMSSKNSFTWNNMFAAYANHGQLKEAAELFTKMPHKTVVSWNSMAAVYSKQGQLKEALQLFKEMPEKDVVSWNTVISACVQQDQLEEAVRLFHQMPERNVVSWNAILAGYVTQGQLKEAHHHFEQMPERDVVSWTTMLSGLSQQGNLKQATVLFDQMPERNVFSWNTMISVYVQHGQIDKAAGIFEQMPLKNVVSWNTMISAYVHHRQLKEAYRLLQQMPEKDMVSWTLLLSAYIEEERFEEAIRLFQQMPMKDIVSWTAVLSAYAKKGKLKDVLDHFCEMLADGMKPDKITFISLLDACTRNTALHEGRWVHSCLLAYKVNLDVIVGTTLINMYAKCGKLGDARKIFEQIPEGDVILWTTMIEAYAQSGHGKEVFEIIKKMQVKGILLNEVSLCCLLSGCSHAGLIDDGCHHFLSMNMEHGIVHRIEHYNCIIDLLGRTGWLEEAEILMHNMSIEPGSASWVTLLGSCRTHGDIDRGLRASKHSCLLDLMDPAPCILLSNIFAAAGLFGEAKNIDSELQEGIFPARPRSTCHGIPAASGKASKSAKQQLPPFSRQSTSVPDMKASIDARFVSPVAPVLPIQTVLLSIAQV